MIMIIAFFILLVLVLLLIIPVKFKISFDYNIFKNRGFLKIKLFNFKMFYYKLKLNKNKIVLSNFKTTKELNLEINKKNIDYAKELQNEILKRLYLKELIVYFNFGLKDKPFPSAIICSGIETVLSVVSSLIKFQKPTAIINYKVSPYYSKDIFNTDFNLIISISITNLIISLLKAKRHINKKERYKINGNKAKASN